MTKLQRQNKNKHKVQHMFMFIIQNNNKHKIQDSGYLRWRKGGIGLDSQQRGNS